MPHDKSQLDLAVAKAQIDSAARRMSNNEKLEDLHQESVAYMNGSMFVMLVMLFIGSLMLAFYGVINIVVVAALAITGGILMLLLIKMLKKKRRVRDIRRQAMSKYKNKR